MSLPTLSEIHIYPVKSLGGIALQRWSLDEFGLRLDRRWMVVDPEGQFLTQRQYPQMARIRPRIDSGGRLTLFHPDQGEFAVPPVDPGAPRWRVKVWSDTVAAVPVSGAADRWLSEAIGIACRLVWFPDDVRRQVDTRYARKGERTAFSDGFPLLLISQASLDDLNGRLPNPVPMHRFRPNLVVAGTEPYAEDHWQRIQIGAVTMRVVKPCSRCIITTVDPETGRRTGQEPLATLAKYRRRGNRVYFGQNLIHEGSGTLQVGDPVRIWQLV
ncbi:MAG TPA: MOSC domain-containing protein [Methylothermaceae bacterium]|nr:MOSC domain-containing protein [Methylothermaceae bacterium]